MFEHEAAVFKTSRTCARNGYRTSNSCRRWSSAVPPRHFALCQSAQMQYQPLRICPELVVHLLC